MKNLTTENTTTNTLDTEGMELLKKFLSLGTDMDVWGGLKKYYQDILNGKCNVNKREDALFYACLHEEYKLAMKFIEAGNDKIDSIVGYGFGLEEFDDNNITNKELLDFMKIIAEKGANINERAFIANNIRSFDDDSNHKHSNYENSTILFENIKSLLELGADPSLADDNGNTPLMLIAEKIFDTMHGLLFEDHDPERNQNIERIVTLLLDYGADINAVDKMGMTALMKYALNAENHSAFNVDTLELTQNAAGSMERLVKILIDRGADINITSSMTALDLANNENIKKIISNSKNQNPQKLVKLLSNFTLDKPLKYSTHYWDFDLKQDYQNFDSYMKAVTENFKAISTDLKDLSPNLHNKIEVFLFATEPNSKYSWCSRVDINIGWSSLAGLKEWCDEGKKPSEFKLTKPIKVEKKYLKKFEDVINLFKQEIEIRSEFNNLGTIFNKQKENINEAFLFTPEKSKLDKQFYTDTQNLREAINLIFKDVNKRVQYPQIEVITKELEDRSIEIKIIQMDSSSDKSANDLFKKATEGGGDMGNIKTLLFNLCDWSVESSHEDENFRINFLHSSNVKEIKLLDEKPEGFTHILRFYK